MKPYGWLVPSRPIRCRVGFHRWAWDKPRRFDPAFWPTKFTQRRRCQDCWVTAADSRRILNPAPLLDTAPEEEGS